MRLASGTAGQPCPPADQMSSVWSTSLNVGLHSTAAADAPADALHLAVRHRTRLQAQPKPCAAPTAWVYCTHQRSVYKGHACQTRHARGRCALDSLYTWVGPIQHMLNALGCIHMVLVKNRQRLRRCAVFVMLVFESLFSTTPQHKQVLCVQEDRTAPCRPTCPGASVPSRPGPASSGPGCPLAAPRATPAAAP